jgi:hypothetical protein
VDPVPDPLLLRKSGSPDDRWSIDQSVLMPGSYLDPITRYMFSVRQLRGGFYVGALSDERTDM